MIPLAVPNLTGNEREYLDKCIETTFVSSVGEFVNKIEEMSAKLTGAEYGVATSAGTTALHTALVAAGVKRDNIVIIPSFTFIATANAVSHTGAIPWLMDVDRTFWTIDLDQLEFELETKTELNDYIDDRGNNVKGLFHKESGRRIAAIMPVYTLGNMPDMYRMKQISSKYELPIIADAAAAIGSKYKEKKVAEFADMTVLSFNGNKTITAGGGGMILGNNKELTDLCKHLSTTARVTKEYDFDMVGYNYRMTNIQAAVGVAQLERLDEFVNKKRYIRNYYKNHLSEIHGKERFSFFEEPDGVYSACWFSGIVIDDGNIEKTREICNRLRTEGIEARSFWKPIHLQKPYQNSIFADSLKVSEEVWEKIITLPCSTGILDKELLMVVEAIKRIL